MKTKKKTTKKDNRGDLLKEWQTRLAMLDWRIDLNVDCEQEDCMIGTTECAGTTEYVVSNKQAIINIVKEETYNKKNSYKFDFEEILVHELLHCKFSLIQFNERTFEEAVTYNVIHQYVDDLAKALVAAKRNQPKY